MTIYGGSAALISERQRALLMMCAYIQRAPVAEVEDRVLEAPGPLRERRLHGEKARRHLLRGAHASLQLRPGRGVAGPTARSTQSI